MSTVGVRDFLSNAPEQIEQIAKIVGRGARQQVFVAAYRHKSPVKSVGEIQTVTGLSRMRVLQELHRLAQNHILKKTKKGEELAYETYQDIQAHKAQILRLAGNRHEREKLPTKRRVRIAGPIVVRMPATKAKAISITIDDVTSFARVKGVRPAGNLPEEVSEDDFKQGVQTILGESGNFKDWGGENSDLYSTRVIVAGKRRRAAFAFKGPGYKGKLVPGKMGKNGDQLQRMFRQAADVFFVQHWREISDSVPELMQKLAREKSVSTGRPVWYGIIDGQDSQRLRKAYPKKFGL
jgi:hypothetical protein